MQPASRKQLWERHKRWRRWLRETTGLSGIMRYNVEQAIRNTRGLHRFLGLVNQSAFWGQKAEVSHEVSQPQVP